MATPYQSSFDETLGFSDTNARLHLLQDAVLEYEVAGASDKKFVVLFEYNDQANIFVGLNYSPTAPAAGTIVTTNTAEFRPCKRFVKGGDKLYFVTPDTNAYMGISLRQIPS